MSTGKKRIKIELEDAEGGKYNLSLEGNLSKDKIQKVLQLVENLNISKDDLDNNLKLPMEQNNSLQKYDLGSNLSSNSIGSKIWSLIENNFAYTLLHRQMLPNPMKNHTVSSYNLVLYRLIYQDILKSKNW
ncbi:hypothetical protein [Candidatus Nitrosocosmicus sp. T]